MVTVPAGQIVPSEQAGGYAGVNDIAGVYNPKPYSPMAVIGSTGLQRSGGWVLEEWLQQLYGINGVRTYKEMRDNDPIISAILSGYRMMFYQTKWRVKPASKKAKDVEAAKFLEECMHDMEQEWKDTVGESLSMLPFGWAFHEIVYKRRKGLEQVSRDSYSKYTDNRIGWRCIPLRAQETFYQWIWDDEGYVVALQQIASPDYITRTIPMSKGMLFRVGMNKNNPEGVSLLRGAFRPWYFKKNIEEVEAIGVERDLAGLPVALVPPEILSPDADPSEQAVLSTIQQLITSVRRDETEGVIFPATKTVDGKDTGYSFQLLSSNSRRQFDTDKIVSRYNQQICMVFNADFLMLGHERTGSLALGVSKIDMFVQSMKTIIDVICNQFNKKAIPDLFALNTFNITEFPVLEYDEIDPIDVNMMGQYVTALAGSKLLTLDDPDLENHLRDIAEFPSRPAGQKMPVVQEQEQADKLAEQQAEQAKAQMQQTAEIAQNNAKKQQLGAEKPKTREKPRTTSTNNYSKVYENVAKAELEMSEEELRFAKDLASELKKTKGLYLTGLMN